MFKVVMQTAELVSTIESTERLVKILNSAFSKADLEQVSDNATQMNAEEIIRLLRLLTYFEDLIEGTIGDWDTETIDVELKPYSKPFSCKYCSVPRINKGAFRKELQHLVKIGISYPVQLSQYSTPVFIIPNK